MPARCEVREERGRRDVRRCLVPRYVPPSGTAARASARRPRRRCVDRAEEIRARRTRRCPRGPLRDRARCRRGRPARHRCPAEWLFHQVDVDPPREREGDDERRRRQVGRPPSGWMRPSKFRLPERTAATTRSFSSIASATAARAARNCRCTSCSRSRRRRSRALEVG